MDDNQTIEKYENALKIRDIEIGDLKGQILTMQAQIQSLTAQVVALQTEKKVLEDTVSGKEYLVKLVTAVEQFQMFAIQAQAEHKEILTAVNDIKKSTNLTKRNADPS